VALVSLEPSELKRLIRQRRRCGGDRFDEVWDRVYVMAPPADNEHQSLGFDLAITFKDASDIFERAKVFHGCNVSDRSERWKRNYRCPDVAVFLPDNPAEDGKTHWFGGPDFAVEVMSRFDKSRKKFGFYKSVGVRELLLVDRHPWALELHRVEATGWNLVGRADLQAPGVEVASNVLGLTFQLVSGVARPQIKIIRYEPRKEWLV
jgi:Uma2 family endonuclease